MDPGGGGKLRKLFDLDSALADGLARLSDGGTTGWCCGVSNVAQDSLEAFETAASLSICLVATSIICDNTFMGLVRGDNCEGDLLLGDLD